jgi:hypothetical protein
MSEFKTLSAVSTLSSWMGLGLLLLALAVPSPLVGWFDGLPWTGRVEMVVMVLVVPLLFFWRLRIFSSRLLMVMALLVTAIKLLLGGLQSAEGLGLDVFENKGNFGRGAWEKNWSSLWIEEGTAIQRKGLERAAEFPLEWLNRYNQVEKLPDGSWSGDLYRREVQPWVQIHGWVWTLPGEKLILDFGSDLTSISAQLARDKKELDRGARIEMGVPAKEGWSPVRIEFRIDSVFSDRASFRPSIRFSDGQEMALFGLNRTRALSGEKPTPRLIVFGPWVGRLLDGLTAICLSIPLLGLFRQLPRPVLLQFFGLTGLAIGGPWLVGALGMELTGRLTYGLVPALLYAFYAKEVVSFFRPGRALFWILGVGAMPLFAVQWWGDMTGMSFFEVGDDWLAQQNLARAIFVGGDWLSFASEKIYVYQPGYRYFTGFLHLLLGQSAWPSRMLDAWAVVAVAAMVPALCLWAGTTHRWALLAGFLAFAAYCSRPPFRLMGQCIHEYVGAALLVGVAWLIVHGTRSPWKFMWLGALAAAAYLVRQNHLFAILACGLFFLPRMEGSLGQALGSALAKIRKNITGLLFLAGALGLAILGVCLRNWISAGVFNINNPGNLAANSSSLVSSWADTLGLIIRAKAVGGWSHMGFLIALGIGSAALTTLCRCSFVRRIPMEPALVLMAALVPFLWIRLYACTERFSYVLVPWAAVAVATFASGLSRRKAIAA